MEALIERMQQLATHGGGRWGGGGSLSLQQDEAYRLAQALGRRCFPQLQRDLEQARLEFMELLRKHRAMVIGDVVGPHRKLSYRERWHDHQITPEVTRDPALAGLIVPRELSQRLIRLHKEQISKITDLLARREPCQRS